MASRRISKSWSRSLCPHLTSLSFAEGLLGLTMLCLGFWHLSPAQSGSVSISWSTGAGAGAAYEGSVVELERHHAPESIVPSGSGRPAGLSLSAKHRLASLREPLGEADVRGGVGGRSAPRLEVRAMPLGLGATALAGATARLPQGKRLISGTAVMPAQFIAPRSRMGNTAPAWLKYAASPPRPQDGRPMIAIVIDDLGLNRRKTAAATQLDAPLTLAFLPYARDLRQQSEKARAAGHELLLHMPMEPLGHEWPGPDALMSSLSPPEFKRRLRAAFDSFSAFVGLNNHMGSRLTSQRRPMALLMTELRERGLLFLDSVTVAHSMGAIEAERHRVPFARRDVFLDNEIELNAVRRQLASTERLARRQGYAVAIGHPHDVTIHALRSWLPAAKRRGFELVPISTIAGLQTCTQALFVASCQVAQNSTAVRTVAFRDEGAADGS